jgi:hypothetical protein
MLLAVGGLGTGGLGCLGTYIRAKLFYGRVQDGTEVAQRPHPTKPSNLGPVGWFGTQVCPQVQRLCARSGCA